MRIVITKNGKKIVHELEDESPKPFEKEKSKYKYSSSMSKLPAIVSTNDDLLKKYSTRNNEFIHKVLRYRDTYQSKRSSSIIDKNAIESFYNRDDTKINSIELNQAKKVKLSHPKLNMTQAFLDKYDNYDLTYKEKLNELTNNLNSKMSSPQKSEEKENNNKKKEENNGNNNQIVNNNVNIDSSYGFNSKLFSNKNNKINLKI